MRKFKQVDLIMNCILITGFFIASLVKQDYTFIVGYLVVGGWQVISMVVHAVNHWFTGENSSRVTYHWITFVSIVTMPVGSFFILLFTAPVMALYYTWLCYDEVYLKMHRPLALLK